MIGSTASAFLAPGLQTVWRVMSFRRLLVQLELCLFNPQTLPKLDVNLPFTLCPAIARGNWSKVDVRLSVDHGQPS